VNQRAIVTIKSLLITTVVAVVFLFGNVAQTVLLGIIVFRVYEPMAGAE